jgi:hypothetical protein
MNNELFAGSFFASSLAEVLEGLVITAKQGLWDEEQKAHVLPELARLQAEVAKSITALLTPPDSQASTDTADAPQLLTNEILAENAAASLALAAEVAQRLEELDELIHSNITKRWSRPQPNLTPILMQLRAAYLTTLTQLSEPLQRLIGGE